MAITPVQIVNQALARIGQTKRIASMTEASPAALVASACFDTQRDTVLAAAWWPFAKKDIVLLQRADISRAGWTYCYALPADCLAPRFLWRDPEFAAQMPDIPFEIQANDTGLGIILCTNYPDARLVYTRTIPNLALLSQDFIDAFIWRLGAELALGIKQDQQLAQGMLVGYEKAISAVKARFYNAERQRPRVSSFEQAYGGGTCNWNEW